MKNHLITFRIAGIAGLFCALSFTSCTPLQQQRAGVGALAGGAVGALAGDDENDIVRGSVIGAALGAGSAALQEQRQTNGNNGISDTRNQTQPAVSSAPVQNKYPLAQTTETPGYVKSPYRPYNTIDVTGIPSGKMAKEPGTKNIFIIP